MRSTLITKVCLAGTIALGVLLSTKVILMKASAIESTTESNSSESPETHLSRPKSLLNITQELYKAERSLQKDNLLEFRKKQQTEYQEKRKQLMEQQHECNSQVAELRKQRQQSRQELMKACLPAKPSPAPTTKEEWQKANEERKAKQLECKQKIQDFDVETRKQQLEIKQSCFKEERKVLGLSTDIPSE